MEISREAILDKTHYGLKIYAYVLRQYYPNQTVLSVKGRDCGITRNPFNGGKETLRIHIDGIIATHRDTELEAFKGDVFDFAQYHFRITDEEELFQKINKELHLNLEVKEKDELEWLNEPDDTWYANCSFFKAPVRNVFPSETLRLHQVFALITSDKYKRITEELRAITNVKEARKFKANRFDYVTLSGTFEKRSDSNLLKHSNLLTIDFDHLDKLQELKTQLLNDECFETEMLFTSPSGDGLKWIIRIDILEVSHSEYFIAVANYIKQTYNIEVDQSGKDVSRACFLPYDPTAFLHKRHQKIMTKSFNPKDWLDVPKEQPKLIVSNNATTNVVAVADNDIESYITAIEQSGTDITGNYATWRDLGFALAEEYGESGRDYFHRISKNYSGYNTKECDAQFDKCLNAKGHGITIATFYHYAHQSGIKPTKKQYNSEVATNVVTVVDTPNESMPTIPETVYENLPQFLQQVVNPANGQEEKDILLLGALTAFSACFPKLFGIYDQRKVFCNLYLFVTAPASAGKGRLNQIKNLVEPVHKLKREQAKVLKQQFQTETATYNMNKGKDENLEKPSKPPERMLFIPANNSVTGVYQLISDNKGRGLIFETEGDTLAQAFKSDYGNYSDGFRKAFHHETISYYRRTDREYVDIEKPCLSTVLSGTPKQVATLIPNAENGLFSRFMFYYMNIKPTWKNVFQNSDKVGLDDYYNQLGSEFLGLYKTLKNNPEIEIRLATTQQQQFNTFFESLQTKYINLQPEEYIATIRRLGLIAFRVMMLFTAFRIMEDGDVNATKECEDIDFQNALTIISILVKHSSKVFNDLPIEQKATKRLNKKERFLESLPKQFNRQDYLDLATKQNIPHKTAEGYITKFVEAGLLHREKKGVYINQ